MSGLRITSFTSYSVGFLLASRVLPLHFNSSLISSTENFSLVGLDFHGPQYQQERGSGPTVSRVPFVTRFIQLVTPDDVLTPRGYQSGR